MDLVRHPYVFLDHVLRRIRNEDPDRISGFTYPKGENSLRTFDLVSPADLVATRTLVSFVVPRADALLPSNVVSNRLVRMPPRWRFQDPRTGWMELQRRARSFAEVYGAMLRTDVTSFFPSIDVERMCLLLSSIGCPGRAVERLRRFLTVWLGERTRGIPIGGDAFSALGNVYLLPLDIRLASSGLPYLRWMDDLFLFEDPLLLETTGLEMVDEELGLLEVARAIAKTRIVRTREEALADLEDELLTSMAGCVRRGPWHVAKRVVRQRFIEEIVEAETVIPRRFRFILGTMRRRRDASAVYWFALMPELANVDPAPVGDYLVEVDIDKNLGEILVEQLRMSPPSQRDEFDARDLHILRGLASQMWGSSEGDVLRAIGLDEDRRGPVRAWAIMAAVRTPSWKPEDSMERVLEEDDSYVRRAMVLSLKRHRDDKRVRRLLRHIRSSVPDLEPLACWIAS